MKKIILFCSVVILVLTACTKNTKFINAIKDDLKKGANGLELNYKNIEFSWIDTVKVSDSLEIYTSIYNEKLNVILNFNHYSLDSIYTGYLFTKEYLTPERLIGMREWENMVGHPNEYFMGDSSSWMRDGFKNYNEFALANCNGSEFLASLCEQLKRTDSILTNYDAIENGDLLLIETALWYYKRFVRYHTFSEDGPLYESIQDVVDLMKVIDVAKNRLKSMDDDDILYYKAYNKYSINNPFLNGTKQELEKHFYFGKDNSVIHSSVVEP